MRFFSPYTSFPFFDPHSSGYMRISRLKRRTRMLMSVSGMLFLAKRLSDGANQLAFKAFLEEIPLQL